MEFETISFLAGCIFILIALLGGGLEIKELRIPKVTVGARLLFGTFGLMFIIFGVWASGVLPGFEKKPLQKPPEEIAVEEPSAEQKPSQEIAVEEPSAEQKPSQEVTVEEPSVLQRKPSQVITDIKPSVKQPLPATKMIEMKPQILKVLPGQKTSKEKPVTLDLRSIKKSELVQLTRSNGEIFLGYIQNGGWIRYENIDFGSGVRSFQAMVASAERGGVIEIRLDNLNNEIIGTCKVSHTGDWYTWKIESCTLKRQVSGVKTVFMKFKGESLYNFNIKEIKFNR